MSLLLRVARPGNWITAGAVEALTLADTSDGSMPISGTGLETLTLVDTEDVVASFVATSSEALTAVATQDRTATFAVSDTEPNLRNLLRNTLKNGVEGALPNQFTLSSGSVVCLPEEIIAGVRCRPVRYTVTSNGAACYCSIASAAPPNGTYRFSAYFRRPTGATINAANTGIMFGPSSGTYDTVILMTPAEYNAQTADVWVRRDVVATLTGAEGGGQIGLRLKSAGTVAGNSFDVAMEQCEVGALTDYQPTDDVSPYFPVQSAQGNYAPAVVARVESSTLIDTSNNLLIQTAVDVEANTLVESSSVTTSFVASEDEPSTLTVTQDAIDTQFASEAESSTLIDTSSSVGNFVATDTEANTLISTQSVVASFVASIIEPKNIFVNSAFLGVIGTNPDNWPAGGTGTEFLVGFEVVDGLTVGVARLKVNNNGDGSFLIQYGTVPTNTNCIFSAYVRRKSGKFISSPVRVNDGTSTIGTLASASTVNAQTADVWYRYAISVTTTSSGDCGIALASIGSFIGDELDVARLQLEAGSVLSDQATKAFELANANYIATDTEAVTATHTQSAVGSFVATDTEPSTLIDTEDGTLTATGVNVTEPNTLIDTESASNSTSSTQTESNTVIEISSTTASFVATSLDISMLIDSSSVIASFVSATSEPNTLVEVSTVVASFVATGVEALTLVSTQDGVDTQFATETETISIAENSSASGFLNSTTVELNTLISVTSSTSNVFGSSYEIVNLLDVSSNILLYISNTTELNLITDIPYSITEQTVSQSDVSNILDICLLYVIPITRLFIIKPEDRLIEIHQENRDFDINTEIRSLSVNTENRSILIPDEDRNHVINPEDRSILL